MMSDVIIRLETEQDYRAVEEMTRESFWNVYKPGADEHYYAHTMRNHPDYIPELDYVLEPETKEVFRTIIDIWLCVVTLKDF